MSGKQVVSWSRLCVVMAVALIALATASAGSVLAAQGGVAKVKTQTEAWYTTLAGDACDSPANVDCSLLPAAETYPEDTLHVGVSSGKRTAITVFELDLFEAGIPAGMEIAGGKLTLPVDAAPSDGSLRHDVASLIVCHVPDSIHATAGSLAKPPKIDCKAASSPATYQAEPKPVFTVDLTPFAMTWAKGESPVLAVLPAPKPESEPETWHVTFWGKGNESEDAKPISAELNYQPPLASGGTLPPLDTGAGDVLAPPPPMDDLPEPPPVDPIDAPAPEIGESPAKGEAAPPEEEPAPPALAEPRYRTVGYPYPIAWTMPLLLLIGLTATGRALTKNLQPNPGMRLKW